MISTSEKPKVLVFGLGLFGNSLIDFLIPDWNLLVVDIDEKKWTRPPTGSPGIEFIRDAATSRLTWKKIDFSTIKFIVSTLKDIDANLEICRLARHDFKLTIPLILLLYSDIDETLFHSYDVTLVNPLKASLQVILRYFKKNVSQAVNIGLGKGELIEVEIKSVSHLVGRKLKHLRPSHWHISAIYRSGKLIIPDGNSELKINDRVVLMGDPKILENVTSILIKGEPQFPLQFGSDIVFPLYSHFQPHLDEAIYLHNTFKSLHLHLLPFKKNLPPDFTQKIKTSVNQLVMGQSLTLFRDIFSLTLDTGVLVVPTHKGIFHRSHCRQSFKNSRKPFLLSRLTYPYTAVHISLNGPAPARALETGMEIAHIANIPLHVSYVTLPHEMRGQDDEKQLRLRNEIINDFEGIYRESINFSIKEGNPVLATSQLLEPCQNQLLITTFNPKTPLSFFSPNVPYLIARTSHLSTLVIPEVDSDE